MKKTKLEKLIEENDNLKARDKTAFVVVFLTMLIALTCVVGAIVDNKNIRDEAEQLKIISIPDNFEIVSINCSLNGFAYVHYDNETCKECVMKEYKIMNKNSRWYENEYKNSNVIVDDRVNVKQCNSNK